MSEIIPPSIDERALPSTPAHEWADSTANALTSPQLKHTISTPGPSVPGAYPRSLDEENSTSIFEDPSKLKQYLPQVVTSYFDGVQQESKHNLSEVSVEKFSPKPSARRTDSFNTEPESVSNLSTKAEAGSSDGYRTRDSTPLATPNAGGNIPLTPDMNSGANIPLIPDINSAASIPMTSGMDSSTSMSVNSDMNSAASIPVTADINSTTAVRGFEMDPAASTALASDVDSTSSMSIKAAAPESQNILTESPVPGSTPQLHQTNTDTSASVPVSQPHADSGSSVSIFKSEAVPQDKTILMESPVPRSDTPPRFQSSDTAQSNATSTTADVGHDASKRASEPPVTINGNGSRFQETETTPPVPSSSEVSNGSDGSTNSPSHQSVGSSSSPSRSRFMNKIKGEVKVLSGKLGKNEEKIEEGRRMLGKI